ncbi:MAG: hypothetical protein WC457_04245 [Patescibacteria group bacterium]
MDEPQNRFSKEQKIGLVLLSSFVVLAVTLGLIEMRNTLYSPFALNNSIPAMIGSDVDTTDALRYRDTDADGLNDFDELYVYSTSPYLADTDSDGLTDKQEVEGGKNPNCAEGKDCNASIAENGSAIIATSSTDVADTNTLFSNYDVTSTLEAMLTSPDQMRTLLLESGLAQSVVDKISDDDLTKMALEIMSSSTILDSMETTSTTVSDVTTTAKFINQLMNASQ